MQKTKKQLEDEVTELKQKLMEKSAQAHAGPIAATPVVEMVPIKNYGGTAVTITFDLFGVNKAIRLETHGLKQQGKIPLETWLELERESGLVRDGYIARTDQPVTNPNIIDDLDKFTNALNENTVRGRISQITNANVLHKLNDHLSPRERDKTINARELLVLSAVRDRIFELTDLRIIGTDPIGE